MKNLSKLTPSIKRIALLLLIVGWGGCSSSVTKKGEVDNTNRVYFQIEPTTRMIQLPVLINDTVTAKINFDTGVPMSIGRIDSSFCASNPMHLWDTPDYSAILKHGIGIGWTKKRANGGLLNQYHNVPIKFGDVTVNYEAITVSNMRPLYGPTIEGGIMGISKDSTLIWELNFEHNYLELHDADTYKMPDNCMIFPLSEHGKNHPYVTMPISIKCSDGDTITINRRFIIDIGMPWDVALIAPAKELSFFKEKEAEALYFVDSYVSRHVVEASITPKFNIDSLRIYTLKDSYNLPAEYFIGLNFLKRFNVYFDMKNWQLGLVPLKEFNREVNPNHRRFHIGRTKTNSGSFIVTEMTDYKDNYYKTAGVQIGDEVTAINGVKLYKDMPGEEEKELFMNQKMTFDVIRDGKQLQIIVQRDPNEVHGD